MITINLVPKRRPLKNRRGKLPRWWRPVKVKKLFYGNAHIFNKLMVLAIMLTACGRSATPPATPEKLSTATATGSTSGSSGSVGSTSGSSGSSGTTGMVEDAGVDGGVDLDAGDPPADAGADAGDDFDAGPPDAGPPCYIGGVAYDDGGPSPTNGCQYCDGSQSRTSWSDLPSGTVCGAGNAVCVSGTCQSGCYIEGVFYNAGAVHDSCNTCNPDVSTSAWTPNADNTSCGNGFCEQGTCTSGCVIDGGFYAPGGSDNDCRSCDPSQSTSDFSNPLTGAAIDGGHCEGISTSVCYQGDCIPQCNTDTDCPGGMYCEKPSGMCTSGCASDAQCQFQHSSLAWWCAPQGDGGAACEIGCMPDDACSSPQAGCCNLAAGQSCSPVTHTCG